MPTQRGAGLRAPCAQGVPHFALARGVPGVPGAVACRFVLLRYCRAIGAFVCARRPSAASRLRSCPIWRGMAAQISAPAPPCGCAVWVRSCGVSFLRRMPGRHGRASLSAAALPFRRAKCVWFLWVPLRGALGAPLPLWRPGGVPGVLRPSGGAARLLGSAALSPRRCLGAAAPPLLPLFCSVR